MTDDLAPSRISALAAGELSAADAQKVRAELARDAGLARLYGELRAVRRSFVLFAAEADADRPALREQILTATLPRFRSLYGRRTSFWPTWLAAAAAAAVVLLAQPPPVRGALDGLAAASEGVSNLRAAASRHTDRALAELGVLRASLGVALEDRMDRLGDRLRDLERATRRRDGRARAAAGIESAPATDLPDRDTAP